MAMKSKKSARFSSWIGIGLAIGAGLGVVFHNIPVGVGMGIALGAALGALHKKRAEQNSNTAP